MPKKKGGKGGTGGKPPRAAGPQSGSKRPGPASPQRGTNSKNRAVEPSGSNEGDGDGVHGVPDESFAARDMTTSALRAACRLGGWVDVDSSIAR